MITEKELLSIIETLKEFKTILLGYKIEVNTDSKNLAHNTFLIPFDCVVQWIWIIKEYGLQIFYILGPNNIVADALSGLPKINDVEEKQIFSCKVKNCTHGKMTQAKNTCLT